MTYNVKDGIQICFETFKLEAAERTKNADQTLLPLRYLTSGLIFLSEVKSVVNREEEWGNLVQYFMLELKKNLEKHLPLMSCSLYGGVSEACLAVTCIKEVTGAYTLFLSAVHEVLLSKIKVWMTCLDEQAFWSEGDYDFISGVSGTIAYLLLHKDVPQIKETLKALLSLLVKKIPVVTHLQEVHPCFIPFSKLINDRDRLYCPNGRVNLSYAHGISGVLGVLALAKNANINVLGLDQQMRWLTQYIWDNRTQTEEGTHQWRSWIMPTNDREEHDYFKGKVKRMDSWCYGTPGILLGLMESQKALPEKSHEASLNDMLQQFVKQPLESFKLSSPMLCHGLGGSELLIRQMMTFHEVDLKETCEGLAQKTMAFFDRNSPYGFWNTDLICQDDSNVSMGMDYRSHYCFLEGAIGVHLQLLSREKTVETPWMRFLGI